MSVISNVNCPRPPIFVAKNLSMQTEVICTLLLDHTSNMNLEGIVSLFAEKVDRYIPGDTERIPWLGKRHDREGISEFFELLWKNTEPVSAIIDHILVQGTQCAISGKFSTKMLSTETIVDSPFMIHFSTKHGYITRYQLLEDSYTVSQSVRA